jgi:hypothetical protein
MAYNIICKDGVVIENVTVNYIPDVTISSTNDDGIKHAKFAIGAEVRRAVMARMEFLNKWSALSDEELKARITEYYDADMAVPDSLSAEWSKRHPSTLPAPTPEQKAYSEARERVERGELSEEDFEDGVWH